MLALVLVLFAGIYFAIAPRVYTEGIVRLLPDARRARAREWFRTAGNAGLLEIVPYFGPIAAAVPILIVALTLDPSTVLYAGLLLLAIQQIENNLLVPLVNRSTVLLPPVLVLVGTIALALLFGIPGAILATPLLVVAVVCVKMLYMEDILGERVEVPGARPAPPP